MVGVGDRGNVLAEVIAQDLQRTIVAGVTDQPAADKDVQTHRCFGMLDILRPALDAARAGAVDIAP